MQVQVLFPALCNLLKVKDLRRLAASPFLLRVRCHRPAPNKCPTLRIFWSLRFAPLTPVGRCWARPTNRSKNWGCGEHSRRPVGRCWARPTHRRVVGRAQPAPNTSPRRWPRPTCAQQFQMLLGAPSARTRIRATRPHPFVKPFPSFAWEVGCDRITRLRVLEPGKALLPVTALGRGVCCATPRIP